MEVRGTRARAVARPTLQHAPNVSSLVIGPSRRNMPRALWRPYGRRLFLMSEVRGDCSPAVAGPTLRVEKGIQVPCREAGPPDYLDDKVDSDK